jgi:hypothetical protein
VLRAGVGGERGSYLRLFRSDLDSAGSSIFPVGPGRCGLFLLRSEGKEGEKGTGWPGFPHNGRERARKTWESGKAGVPSQWEGTGQEKAGEPGFPRNGRERARKAEKAGKPGFPHNGRERARRKRGKPGFPRKGRERARKAGERGKAGVPSQWEGTGQESGESGLLVGSEAESESELELEEDRDRN